MTRSPAISPQICMAAGRILLVGALCLCAVSCSGGDGQESLAGIDAGLDASQPSDADAGQSDADVSVPSEPDAGDESDADTSDANGGGGDEAPSAPTLELITGPTQLMVNARATLTVRLDRAAEGAVRVQISSGEGALLAAPEVAIPSGALSADLEITAGAQANPRVEITAVLGDVSIIHALAVLERADAPTSIALQAAPNPIAKGGSATLTALLDAPAKAETAVALTSDCGSLDARIAIPAGANAAVADFDARGCAGEGAAIAASAEGLRGDVLTIGIRAAGGRIALNQIMTRGNSANAEFIELFNGSDAAIDLSPYVLWYGGADETSPSTNLNAARNFSLSGRAIAPQGHFLIAFKGALNAFEGVTADIAVDAAGGFNDEEGGSIWLTASDDKPTLESADLVDLVGWGSARSFEGHAPALSPSEENSSIKRQPDGQDTDDNAEDFVWLDTATPRSSASP